MNILDKLVARLKILALVSLLVLVLIWSLVILPNRKAIKRMTNDRSSLQSRLAELHELKRLYGKAFSGLTIFPEREGEKLSNISLMSHLESLARKNDLGELLTYMKPLEERNLGTLTQYLVEMRFDFITPNEIVAFLYALEVEDGIFDVVRSALEPDRKDGSTYDLTLLVSRNVSF